MEKVSGKKRKKPTPDAPKKEKSLSKTLLHEANNKSSKVIGKAGKYAHQKIEEGAGKVGKYVSKPIVDAGKRELHNVVNSGMSAAREFAKKEGRNVFNKGVEAVKEGGRRLKQGAEDLWGRAKKRLRLS